MTDHLFQAFWTGPPLSPLERLSLKSFIDHGHRVALYTYEPSLEVPAGVELRDASEVVPREELVFVEGHDAQRGLPAFSDLFRYALLARGGGWWTDVDVVCTSPEPPRRDVFFAREIDTGRYRSVGCAILRFPAAHPVVLHCLNVCRDLLRRYREERLGEGELRYGFGPDTFEETVTRLGLLEQCSPAAIAYPLHWAEVQDFYLSAERDALRARTVGSAFVHLWGEALARNNLDKWAPPPPGSFAAELYERHGIEVPVDAAASARLERQAGLVRELVWLRERFDEQQSGRRAETAAEAEALRRQLADVLASRSWRWSAPLRALAGRARKLTG